MQQKWWLVAAGVVGIGLAVLLFPRPDTTIDAATPTSDARPVHMGGDDGAVRRTVKRPELSPMRLDRAELTARAERIGPNPIAALNMQNVTPESIHAGRAAGPWTVIRRQLLRMEGDPDAQTFADEFMPMLEQLRKLRTEPESGDYLELEQLQKKYISVVRSNESWMADEIVKASVERLELIHNAYHEAVAAGNADEPEE